MGKTLEFDEAPTGKALQFDGSQQPAFKPTKIGADAFPDSLREVLAGTDWGTRNIAGAGSAVVNAWEGLKGLAGQTDPNQVAAQKVIAEEAPIGNIAGNVAMLAPTAFIPGANTVTGAATIGALQGALLTPGDMAERAKAAAWGGVGGGGGIIAGRALAAGGRAASAAVAPMTRTGQDEIIGKLMRRVSGENADDVMSRLRDARGLVPGEMPTAAEVAESGGIAALQRAMSSADPESYAHRFMANGDAREAALRSVAGSPSARQAAIDSRESSAQALYGMANKSDAMRREMDAGKRLIKSGGIHQMAGDEMPTEGLRALTSRPAFQAALSDAKTSLANSGATDTALTSLEGLHRIKLSIDEALNGAAPNSALAKFDRGSLMTIKKQLLNEMETLSPMYGNARKSFSDMSKPINQMDVGQYLLDKLEPASKEYGKLTGERANAFFQALKDADATTKRALGTRAAGGIADVLTPEQLATVTNVAKSLGRVGNATDLGRGVGSNTFQNLAMDNLAAQGGVPSAVGILANLIPGMHGLGNVISGAAGKVGGLMYKSADQNMKTRLADLLLDPVAASQVMDAASKPGAMQRIVQKAAGTNDQQTIADLLRYLQAAPAVAGMSAAQADWR